jgi:hypothetical protein
MRLASIWAQNCAEEPISDHLPRRIDDAARPSVSRRLTGIAIPVDFFELRHYYQLLHQPFTLPQPAIQIACLD